MPDGLGIATAGRRIAEGLRTREAEKRQRTTEEQKRQEMEEKERLKFEGEKKAFRFRHEGTPVVDYIDDFYEQVGDEHRLHPSTDDLKAWDTRSRQEGEEDAAAIDEISQLYQSLTAEEEPEGFQLPPELLSEFGLFPRGETKTRLDEQALSMQDLAQLSHITGQVAEGREFFGGQDTRELLRGGVGELQAQRATRAGKLAGIQEAAKTRAEGISAPQPSFREQYLLERGKLDEYLLGTKKGADVFARRRGLLRDPGVALMFDQEFGIFATLPQEDGSIPLLGYREDITKKETEQFWNRIEGLFGGDTGAPTEDMSDIDAQIKQANKEIEEMERRRGNR